MGSGSADTRSRAIAAACLAVAMLGSALSAEAVVQVTDPDDATVFLRLFRPTGEFDETALSGFEVLISSRTGEFRANDQLLVAGEETAEATSLGAELGAVGDLSGIPFAFSIQHNLTGGRNFTFILTNLLTSESSVLCWGQSCPPGSVASERLNGMAPIHDYNGLQIQARAQDVVGSSAAVTITSLAGVDVDGAPFFDEVVTPESPGTIPGDSGRRGQWMLGDSLDLVLEEWELTGVVTLTRPDAALTDLTKVRLAVDLVRDPTLPFLLPEPEATLLHAAGLTAVALRAVRERRRRHAARR